MADHAKAKGGMIVLRPDSGDPVTQVIKALKVGVGVGVGVGGWVGGCAYVYTYVYMFYTFTMCTCVYICRNTQCVYVHVMNTSQV